MHHQISIRNQTCRQVVLLRLVGLQGYLLDHFCTMQRAIWEKSFRVQWRNHRILAADQLREELHSKLILLSLVQELLLPIMLELHFKNGIIPF